MNSEEPQAKVIRIEWMAIAGATPHWIAQIVVEGTLHQDIAAEIQAFNTGLCLLTLRWKQVPVENVQAPIPSEMTIQLLGGHPSVLMHTGILWIVQVLSGRVFGLVSNPQGLDGDLSKLVQDVEKYLHCKPAKASAEDSCQTS